LSLLSSNPERIQLKSCAICINKGQAEIRQKTVINKSKRNFGKSFTQKKLNGFFKKYTVKKGTNFWGLSTTKNRWMYEIVTLFANFGVLRTNFIFFKFNYKYLGKITPKFLGMARHLGSA
jgi:hypothetical protein